MPYSLLPQQNAPPGFVTAQVAVLPVLTLVTASPVTAATGITLQKNPMPNPHRPIRLVSAPSWPKSLEPQQNRAWLVVVAQASSMSRLTEVYRCGPPTGA